MYLPGTVNERIGDLRTSKKLSQKELSDMIGIAPSQLNRIEKGGTKTINSDILIGLSKALGVSTDYILGLTTVSVQKSYDISELGLSEGAVKTLVTKSVDVAVLNRLMVHERFPYLMLTIKRYFNDDIAAGVMGRNEMIDFMTATLGDFAKENPDDKTEIAATARLIKSQKMGKHEAELEKIKSTFMAIVRDIKSGIGENLEAAPAITTEMMQGIWKQLEGKPRSEITAEDVSNAVVSVVRQTSKIDEQSAELFKQLAMSLFGKPIEIIPLSESIVEQDE
jgi:transcriptional regulator with XRE-family HTH domain